MLNDYSVLNVKSLLSSEPLYANLKQFIAEYSCPENPEVESFFKEQSLDFTKSNKSVSYIVLNSSTGDFEGYFSLTIKPIQVSKELLSKKTVKRLQRFGKCDETTGLFTISSYLIAQLGKNYSIPKEKQIDGNDLIELAENVLKDIQFQIGCGFIFLECEDKNKLKRFYEKNNYQQYGSRTTETDNVLLLQYIKPF